MRKLALLSVGVLINLSLFAETPALPGATGPYGSTANRPALNPNTVETITPGFFDSKPTSGVSTSDRAKGDEADYDSGQYKEWTEKCAAAKKKSMELFRECFNEEKSKVKRQLKESRESQFRNRNPEQTPSDQLWEKQKPDDGDFDE